MKILITGGTGMIGSAFNKIKTLHEIVSVGTNECDLRDASKTEQLIKDIKPQAVVHLAAKVGGVKGNSDFVGDFFFENISINTNILNSCHKNNVHKVVSVLSTCVYPDNANYPLTEDQIHAGPPHPSNFGYAYAKRMIDIHSKALRQQYGREYVCAVPNNLYGPNDNFDLLNGHVIPAIIRKIWEAKINDRDACFWGSGAPLREFTYSSDFAKILLWMTENYSSSAPLNIGSTQEISIASIVDIVSKILRFEGEIIWDKSMPEGQHRKPSSNSRFLELYGSFDYKTIEDGLSSTIKWFLDNYPNIRGV
jgi:GDP-L-fucose synthase